MVLLLMISALADNDQQPGCKFNYADQQSFAVSGNETIIAELENLGNVAGYWLYCFLHCRTSGTPVTQNYPGTLSSELNCQLYFHQPANLSAAGCLHNCGNC